MRHVPVRNTRPDDFAAIEAITRIVYPTYEPWTAPYLQSHLDVFPEGQFVAVEEESGAVVGMVASLVLNWDDYDHFDSYVTFTDGGRLTNHDPTGRTLYGAEVVVDPRHRGLGIGSALYAARRDLVQRLGLLRIRAGARLPGFSKHADAMTVDQYVRRVVAGTLVDPTLTFQLKHDFAVLGVVPDYYLKDEQSRNYAALIEWLNPDIATPEDIARRDHTFDVLSPA